MDRRDPRVLELAADLGFFDEPPDHFGIVAVLLTDHLNSEIATKVKIAPLEDLAHTAPRKRADELVTWRLPASAGRLPRARPGQPRSIGHGAIINTSRRPVRTILARDRGQ